MDWVIGFSGTVYNPIRHSFFTITNLFFLAKEDPSGTITFLSRLMISWD